MVFVAVHVLTLLFDPYAQLDLVSLVVPFTAGAQPFWYGLGAVALDLILALIGTSLLRRHIGPRVWRAIHWTAYACWPIALAHSLGSGSDAAPAGCSRSPALCGRRARRVGWRLSGRFSEVPAPSLPILPAPRIGVS